MKTKTFAIPIPHPSSPECIKYAILEANDLIGVLTDWSFSHDFRAIYCQDSFKITSVAIDNDNTVTIEYTYEWEAYQGCKDKDTGDIEYDFLTGVLKDSVLHIDAQVYEERSPDDEL